MAAEELTLWSLSKLVDHLPDSFWHKIPGFKPKDDDQAIEKELDKDKDKHKNQDTTSRHHRRRRSEGATVKSRRQSRSRTQSSSPIASQSSDDDAGGTRRSARHRNYDVPVYGKIRRADTAAVTSQQVSMNNQHSSRLGNVSYTPSYTPPGASPTMHAASPYVHAHYQHPRPGSQVGSRRASANGFHSGLSNAYPSPQVAAGAAVHPPTPQAWPYNHVLASAAAQRYGPTSSTSVTPQAMTPMGAAHYAPLPSPLDLPFPSFQPSPCVHPQCPSRSPTVSGPIGFRNPSSSQPGTPYFASHGPQATTHAQPRHFSTSTASSGPQHRHSPNYPTRSPLPPLSIPATSPPLLSLSSSNPHSRYGSVSNSNGQPLRQHPARSRTDSLKDAMGPPPRPAPASRKQSLREQLEDLRDHTPEPRMPMTRRKMTSGIIGNAEGERKKSAVDEEDEHERGSHDSDSTAGVVGMKTVL